MTVGFAVLRPEPGNTATADALARDGHDVLCLPLFEVCPVAWQPPNPERYDAVLVTSANAVRHAGPSLRALVGLPVVAVGEATARIVRESGLRLVATGRGDGTDALATARSMGFVRLLHLTGREHCPLDGVDPVIAYASEAIPVASAARAALAGRVALLHSSRAARRLAALVEAERAGIAVAALSDAVAVAAGPGWRATAVAPTPSDAALRDAAITLAAEIDRSTAPGDKQP